MILVRITIVIVIILTKEMLVVMMISRVVATPRYRNPLATRVVATPRCLRGVAALRCQMQLQSHATMRCEPAL